jgi:hypothetical protein
MQFTFQRDWIRRVDARKFVVANWGPRELRELAFDLLMNPTKVGPVLLTAQRSPGVKQYLLYIRPETPRGWNCTLFDESS